ncbi:MAG: chromosome partitioning protein ParB, partial [Gammaproteobacteria bacterium]|nr:chromosome partitioning protein ParB [Gammaproteobacteria bacterium]
DYEKGRKFAQIKASLAEVGLIEPIILAPGDGRSELHVVLDGHLRIAAARALGMDALACITAREDENYTYNRRINRLATIQEHYMVLRALERGVPEERLARALDIDISALRLRASLLDGICPEVVELLKAQNFGHEVMRMLRKMKPARQIECAELMLGVANFTSSYAAALLAATRVEDLVDAEKPKKLRGLGTAEMARMEQEMSLVQGRFKAIEQEYGTNVLHLVLARGYVAKLMRNPAIGDYLARYHVEILEEFRQIVTATGLEDG